MVVMFLYSSVEFCLSAYVVAKDREGLNYNANLMRDSITFCTQ